MYQAASAAKKPTKSHQKRAVRIARPSVQSTDVHARSTTLSAATRPVPPGTASPSAARPMSSGRRRGSVTLSGNSTTSSRTTSAQHAARQPEAAMSRPSHGNSTMEPMPTPENAMPMASPRRRTNQCGRKSEWPM